MNGAFQTIICCYTFVLLFQKLSVGTLVMGVISEIGELDVVVNLPFGLTGFISGY